MYIFTHIRTNLYTYYSLNVICMYNCRNRIFLHDGSVCFRCWRVLLSLWRCLNQRRRDQFVHCLAGLIWQRYPSKAKRYAFQKTFYCVCRTLLLCDLNKWSKLVFFTYSLLIRIWKCAKIDLAVRSHHLRRWHNWNFFSWGLTAQNVSRPTLIYLFVGVIERGWRAQNNSSRIMISPKNVSNVHVPAKKSHYTMFAANVVPLKCCF